MGWEQEYQLAKTVLKAADWWTRRLNSDHHEAGDAMINAVMAMRASKIERVTPSQKRAFKRALATALLLSRPHYIGVDYGPCEILEEALEVSGINSDDEVLPIKSRMFLEYGTVTACEGYRAPFETVCTYQEGVYEECVW